VDLDKSVAQDVWTLTIAREQADAFNSRAQCNKTVLFPEPMVAQVTSVAKDGWFLWFGGEVDKNYCRGDSVSLEPYLAGTFDKFTNNSVWQNRTCLLPGAFSHFSFANSGGRVLVCDLQGVRFSDCYRLTDPAVHTQDASTGGADFGPFGMLLFFTTHECSELCAGLHTPPLSPKVLDMAQQFLKMQPTLNSKRTSFFFETKYISRDPTVMDFCRAALNGQETPQQRDHIARLMAAL
jgi:hypothetical protein